LCFFAIERAKSALVISCVLRAIAARRRLVSERSSNFSVECSPKRVCG
jgi:hypothetical protein